MPKTPTTQKRAFSVPQQTPKRYLKQAAFQYVGAKFEFADWIVRHLPRGQTLAIPYFGAGSPLWQVTPYPVEVVNDIDLRLMTFFRACRLYKDELAALCAATPYHRREFEEAAVPLPVEKLKTKEGILEEARRFIVVARMSQAGRSSNGKPSWSYAVGHSRRGMSSSVSRWLHVPDTVVQIAERTARVQFECLPALEFIQRYDREGTVFYCDPPYWLESVENKLYRFTMSEADHVALLERLLSCKGTVVLSGYHSTLYDEMLRGWWHTEKEVTCRSNVKADGKLAGRPTRREVLWINR